MILSENRLLSRVKPEGMLFGIMRYFFFGVSGASARLVPTPR
jgi:hypothetical protein